MFSESVGDPGWGILIGILVYALVVAVTIYIGYLIIRTAILRALNSHYKTVRQYEQTGEWAPHYRGMKKPKDIDRA